MADLQPKQFFLYPPFLMRQFMDTLDPGIMFLDTDFRIIFMNKEKRDKNPMVEPGARCYDVFEEYGYRCPFCVCARAMQEKRPLLDVEYVAIQKGREYPVHMIISALPVIDEDGTVLGVIETAYDVENQFQTNKRLERLNKEYEHVIYALSHDLRAPLVSIEGFLRKLTKGHVDMEDEVAMHCLDRIHANVKMMNGLVTVLLDTSRIATGKLEVQEVDVESLLNGLAVHFKARVEEQGAVLAVAAKPGSCMCDKVRVQQIFSNLIGNALEHCRQTQNLVIELGYGNKVFWVKDNGPGMPEDFKSKAFEAFTSLSPKNTDHFGMGLNIVHKIVEKHGGKAWIDSQEGLGTAIYFKLVPSD
jgi:signal transduction histidine kinase